jgi:hypothetical protein
MKRKRFIWLKAGVLSIAVLSSSVIYAKQEKTEDELKATFVSNYIPYIKWPANVYTPDQPITICVMTGDITADYLRRMNDNPGKHFTLKVKEKDKKSSFSDCHILFINKDYENDKDYFIKVTQGKPILTVSDIPGFAQGGGITGFQMPKGKDAILELNLRSAKAANINIDADLLAIMNVIQ